MARQRKLYSLKELSELTGVSYPTLLRYKKLHADRIPSVGEGRTQKYPKEAAAAIEKIRQENLGKRGRPKKSAAKKSAARKSAAKKKAGKKKAAMRAPRKATKSRRKTRRASKKAPRKSARRATGKRASKRGTGGRLLTLTEISKITGISYPTLSRYVKLFLDKIPHVGDGRKRRFPRRAVAAFKKLRAQSRRGRRPKAAAKKNVKARRGIAIDAALGRRIQALEQAQAEIGKQLKTVIRELKKPLKLTIRG